jgi:hypothetical protein
MTCLKLEYEYSKGLFASRAHCRSSFGPKVFPFSPRNADIAWLNFDSFLHSIPNSNQCILKEMIRPIVFGNLGGFGQ